MKPLRRIIKLIQQDRQIVAISFLILFLELLLIRLISTEIRIFAYLSNTVLLAIFIGSGLGMMLKKKISLFHTSFSLFLLTIFISMNYIVRLPNLEFRLFKGITELLVPLSEAYIWGQLYSMSKTGIIIGLVLTFALFALIAWIFVPLGQFLGRLLDAHQKPLWAYSVNIAASLLGIWTFQLLSISQISPFLGIIMVQLLLIFLNKKTNYRLAASLLLAMTIASIAPKTAHQPHSGPVNFWSPYQKLTLSLINKVKDYEAEGWFLEVNDMGYMGLFDLSDEKRSLSSALIADLYKKHPSDINYIDQYTLPYKFIPQPENVLLIGVGGGNDVAAAIREQAVHIDAVEIDPTIVSIGKRYHPEEPYQQENVNLVVDDGRAFMQRTDKKYDLIIMGLADSQTLGSAMTNLRLDNYLYTLESLQQLKSLLTEDGIAFISFEVIRPWIGARIKQNIQLSFEQDPLIFDVRSHGAFGWGGIMFVSSKQAQTLDSILQNNPDLADFIARRQKHYDININVLSDNWPYLYLDKPRIPLIHLILAVVVITTLLVFSKRVSHVKTISPVFFLLGAGFLLFEFQNISKSSLIFGSTWITSLLIISAFLLLNLLANYLVKTRQIKISWAYKGLFIALLIQLLIPIKSYNYLFRPLRLVIAPIIMSLPVFFSGIIFASLFKKSKDRSQAFASNLLGMAVGGLMESLSFFTGIHALLYLTLGIYGLSWVYVKGKSR